MQCLISDLKFSDRGGEPDDLYYEVTFREYRSYGVSQMTVITADGTTAAVAGPGANLTQADGQISQVITASVTPVREMDSPQMVRGASLVLNGSYYRTSAADLIAGTASGETAALTRIEQGTAAPYYVEGYGWFEGTSLSLAGVTA